MPLKSFYSYIKVIKAVQIKKVGFSTELFVMSMLVDVTCRESILIMVV